MFRDILIMAKSNKHGSYCIAGIDIKNMEWVRPVSSLTEIERAVPSEDVICENGEEVNVLDIVRINFIQPIPSKAQNENILYNKNIKWKKIDTWDLDDLILHIQPQNLEFLFENTKKDLLESELTGESLAFVKIEHPSVFIKSFKEKRKVQLNFCYNGQQYRYIKISDPEVLEIYNSKTDGNYPLGQYKYAVFSLTDKYVLSGKYYKMLAKLF